MCACVEGGHVFHPQRVLLKRSGGIIFTSERSVVCLESCLAPRTYLGFSLFVGGQREEVNPVRLGLTFRQRRRFWELLIPLPRNLEHQAVL